MTRTFVILLFTLSFSVATAQQHNSSYFFKDKNPSSLSNVLIKTIPATRYRLLSINLNKLSAELNKIPHRDEPILETPIQIALPLPDGTVQWYNVVENSTLHPELREQFPMIKTYDAYGVSDPSEFVKLDLTSQGFHAMILKPGRSPIFIDPIKQNEAYYISYYKKDFITNHQLKCGVHGQTQLDSISTKSFANFNTCQLKKYRLAMAATAQYTQYQGGTVNDALSAQATTMNRVNGVYETDMAITMQIIANNNLIIYTDPNNQPYTHGNPDRMIEQNQVTVSRIIGANNYDIGHVVDSAGSGLAELGSVCTDNAKARGVTGTVNPVGDPFDIDYVAHEMGHQFGANHVQNNDCNRNDATAVEPGSGSTIMGYAGICAPNVQKNSNAYFNGISLQEMGAFVSSPNHTCPIKTTIPKAPMINNTNGGVTIPAQTPFALTASASRSMGNGILSYTWEQMDNEVTQQPPVSTATGGPNFRSVPPQTTGTRFFPNLNALSNDGPFTWEVIPSVSRTMKFRTTVRSNTSGGSCNAYTDTTITTTSNAGPFVVTSPTREGIQWNGYSSQSVTWDVANTHIYPVHSTSVNIYLSVDGGKTFPYPIILNTANNGSRTICVPNFSTNKARIMVQASNGTFFNISKNNFSISTVPHKAPILTAANRNRMNLKEAFVLYTGCNTLSNVVYSVNGLPGATIKLDVNKQRFIIGNIQTPKKIYNVTISAKDEQTNITKTSNPITIPSIL